MRVCRHSSSGSERLAEKWRKVREMIHGRGLSSLTRSVLCNGEAGLMGLRLVLWWESSRFFSIVRPTRLRISGTKGPNPQTEAQSQLGP